MAEFNSEDILTLVDGTLDGLARAQERLMIARALARQALHMGGVAAPGAGRRLGELDRLAAEVDRRHRSFRESPSGQPTRSHS